MSLKPRQYKQVYECKTRQMYRHRHTTQILVITAALPQNIGPKLYKLLPERIILKHLKYCLKHSFRMSFLHPEVFLMI